MAGSSRRDGRGESLKSAPTTADGEGAAEVGSLPRKQILRRALRSDPEQEYFVYVPSTADREAPLLVAVHGISRNAQEQAKQFASYCETYGVVLVAPSFPAPRHREYRRLGRARRGQRADAVLDAIIDEIGAWVGISTQRIHLFGYSAGAQFAHRYTMAHPDRVARAAIACADGYTFPKPEKRFPYGIRASRKLSDVRLDPSQFLRVPIAVFVGRPDDASLRRVEPARGRRRVSRREKARSWVTAMREAAVERQLEPLVSYEELAGGDQSFKQFMKNGPLGSRVFEALFGPPPSAVALVTVGADASERAVLVQSSGTAERFRGAGADLEVGRARFGSRRARRIALGLVLFAASLALATPLGLYAHYRFTYVVARDALVKGHIADVGAQRSGVVRGVAVDAGDRVEAGQVVARLEDRQLRAGVRQARSQLEKATRELEVERLAIENERLRLESRLREASAGLAVASAGVLAWESRADEAQRNLEQQRSLAQRGFIAEEQVRTAENELRTARALAAAALAEQQAASATHGSAEVESEGIAVRRERVSVLESQIAALGAELAAAEAALEGATIRAPDEGAVVRRIVEPGGSTVVGQPIISLWVGNEIWVEAWIDEEDLADVEVGSLASVTLMPYPDREFSGVVESMGVSTDFELPETEVPQPRQSRMRGTPVVAVRIRLDDPAEGLLPGLSAVVAIRRQGS